MTTRSPVGPATLVRAQAAALAVCGCLFGAGPTPASAPEAMAIAPAPLPSTASGAVPALNSDRILGVIPNYQTVNDPGAGVAPLTPKQKWSLAWKETVDPFNVANAFVGAAFSQMDHETPDYGKGAAPFGMRFGAAVADFSTQNFFSAGLIATVLHQDPRYFRLGPQAGVWKRLGYSISRLAVARQDSGAAAFNASNFLGMGLGIAASNAYYPSASRNGTVMLQRLSTSLTGGVIGNLMSEFWPDIQRKLPFFHKKQP